MEPLQVTTDADALTTRITALLASNRPAPARHLLSAVRRILPPSPELAELAARLAASEGRPERALDELDEGIDRYPDHVSLRKCRADLRMQSGDIDGALEDAAEAVVLDRSDPTAKALLGVLLLEKQRRQEAIACLAEAVAAEPANAAFRQALATAQEADGAIDAALTTLATGIADAPSRADLRNAAILICVRRRDFTLACQLAEEARAAGVADACSFGLMGHALSSLGRHGEAAEAYREALKLGPNDPYVRHLVAASGIAAGERLGPALDLGCGTGLVGLALSDLPVAPLVGIDVSPRMLHAAKAKQLYAGLHEGDLITFMAEDTRRWQLVLAADLVIYFGALNELLAGVHDRLEPGGWFVFSVEELVPDHEGVLPGNGDWMLHRQGRYAHSIGYVAGSARAAGFDIRVLTHEVVRFEADAPVPGLLAVLERRQGDR